MQSVQSYAAGGRHLWRAVLADSPQATPLGFVQEYAPGGDMYGALAAAGGFLHEVQVAGGVMRPLLSALTQLHSQARIPMHSQVHMLTCRSFSRCRVRYRSNACAAAVQLWFCCSYGAGTTLCEHSSVVCIYKIPKSRLASIT